MSNVTVQEALNEAIEMITILCNGSLDPTGGAYKVVNKCKAALAEIDKCEPVINLNILKYTEHGVIPDDFKGQASGYRAGWNDCLSSIQYMFSQPIEKCEPVGELILDPVFLPALKAPLVNWKINLVDLEVGTKLYTSPQPRDWVGLSDDIDVEKLALGSGVHKSCGVSQYFRKDFVIKHTSKEQFFYRLKHFAESYLEAKCKQLNTKG